MAFCKSLLACAFFVLTFFNLENVSGETHPLADLYLKRVSRELVSPLERITEDLRNTLQEVELRKEQVRTIHEDLLDRLASSPCQPTNEVLEHAVFLKSWSFDSCVNFTDDCRLLAEVAWDCGDLVGNISQRVMTIGSNLLNCPSINPVTTVKCFNANISDLKDLVLNFKNTTMPLVEEGEYALQKTRLDFDHCLGIPVTSHLAIEDHLKKC